MNVSTWLGFKSRQESETSQLRVSVELGGALIIHPIFVYLADFICLDLMLWMFLLLIMYFMLQTELDSWLCTKYHTISTKSSSYLT